MPDSIEGFEIRISKVMLFVHKDILDKAWAELECRWDITALRRKPLCSTYNKPT
jgi:hypothetical protein